MHIVVIGAGALGSIYAAYLARGGHDVSLIARGARGAALARHGIRVTGREEFVARCNVVAQPDAQKGADLLILATKTYDSDGALLPLQGMEVGSAFSVQNGVLKNEQLIRAFGARATLGAVSMLGGQVMPAEGDCAGAVLYNMPGSTTLGEPAGGDSQRAKQVERVLLDAGLGAQTSDRITSVEWSKFVGWSGLSTLAILTRLPTWRFLVESDTALIAARVMRETAAVARRQGVELLDSGFSSQAFLAASEEEAVKMVQAHGEKLKTNAPSFRQSILQDADRGRRLEVNETLGHTLILAKQLNVPAPTLDLCCRVLQVVSRAAQPYEAKAGGS